ncbi:MAG: hypothetical protein OXH00_17875 [Candidatus Poribacteria bacterium]|nr:hypothetical protein [Candidatus Poribacteria bacterium]
MNDKTIDYIATLGLDMLKRAVLCVLYERRLLLRSGARTPGGSPYSPLLSTRHIRERFGMRDATIVHKILSDFKLDKYVESAWVPHQGKSWQITDKGVQVIEG